MISNANEKMFGPNVYQLLCCCLGQKWVPQRNPSLCSERVFPPFLFIFKGHLEIAIL